MQAFDAAGNPTDFPGSHHDTFRPFLRGANADTNVTFAMSLTFFVLWLYWAFTEIGVKGFFAHVFAPKGSFKGPMLILMVIIFVIVGCIELVSFSIRPLTLALRLYGNIYGGENLLETLLVSAPHPIIKILGPLPFYFMELMVGMIQAFVFTLLSAIFIKLMCEHHDDEHGEEAHH